jgi:exodeoxyribonuclease V gamma subunit
VCNHPLQAFSENYFNGNDARLFSYKNAYTKIKKSKQAPSQIFIKQPLEALADQKKQLNLNELIRFYQNPARTFLKERFNISNFDKDLVLPIREPFELEAFKNRDIRQQVLDSNCAEDSLKDSAQVTQYKDALTSLRAKGLLPYGDIGSKLFESEENTIQQFIKKLPEFDELSKQDFQLTFDEGFSLRGELNNVSDSGRLIQQVSQPFAGDYISLWINHLVLNTQNLNDAQSQTHFYSPEIRFKLLKVDNSHSILQKLIQYYWQGLHFPLHFYAKPAFKQYADKQENGGIGKAESAWTSDHFGTSEAQKFENWLLYRAYSQDELFDNEYEAISDLMMGDLFLHYEES